MSYRQEKLEALAYNLFEGGTLIGAYPANQFSNINVHKII